MILHSRTTSIKKEFIVDYKMLLLVVVVALVLLYAAGRLSLDLSF